MKKYHILFIFVALIFVECHAPIDLNNLDSSSEVKMGLAMPVGSMSATIGDFIGDSTIQEYIHVKQPGDNELDYLPDYTLYFRHKFEIQRNFHPVIVSNYTGSTNETLLLKDQLPESLITSGKIPAGTQLTLEFPTYLSFLGINQDPLHDAERLDSIVVTNAYFNSFIDANFAVSKNDIVKVEIIPSDAFTLFDGTPMPAQDILFEDFGQDMSIELHNFCLSLIKDHTKKPGLDNVVDQVKIIFRFTLKTQQDIVINASSSFNYKFETEFIDYDAVFGFFEPGKEMGDNKIINIIDVWEGWESIKNLKLKVAKPTIEVTATHEISAPLLVEVHHIFSQPTGKPEERMYAAFGPTSDDKEERWRLDDYPSIDSKFGTSSHNSYTLWYTGKMVNNRACGNIDRLLNVRPDQIGYSYDISIDGNREKQYRLTRNTAITINADITVPFVFNEGSSIGYADTADIDFSKLSYDSIVENFQFIDTIKVSDLKLYLIFSNYIPFEICASYQFMDSHYKPIELDMIVETVDGGTMNGHRINIEAPHTYSSQGIAENPGKKAIMISINRETFDKLKDIKYLYYDAELQGNPKSATILSTTKMKVQIGLAANVDAVLDVQKLIDNNDQEENKSHE